MRLNDENRTVNGPTAYFNKVVFFLISSDKLRYAIPLHLLNAPCVRDERLELLKKVTLTGRPYRTSWRT